VVELVETQPDELELVGLGGQLGARLCLRDDPALEPLPAADDALHLLLDGLQVLRGERIGDIEVVVEAVGDRWADAEPGIRVDLLHGLRHHVRRRVAQDAETVGRVDRHGFDGVALRYRRCLVAEFAVDAERDDGPVGEQVETGLRAHPLNDTGAATAASCATEVSRVRRGTTRGSRRNPPIPAVSIGR
jgi:hypothetical protein